MLYRLILFCLFLILSFNDIWALSFSELQDVVITKIRKVEKDPNIKIEFPQHRDLQNRNDISYDNINIHKPNKFVVSVFLGKKRYLLHGLFHKYLAVPTIKKRIIKGQVISGNDIETRDFSVNALPPSVIIESNSMIGMVAKRNLEAGSPLKKGDIKKRIVIARGDSIILKFVQRSLAIEASATALGSGGVGDLIKVKIQNSNKVVVGEIIDSSTVQMKNDNKP